nr:MAG TPA_asm: hypothetical protein [Caudoviricetes sp.]
MNFALHLKQCNQGTDSKRLTALARTSCDGI